MLFNNYNITILSHKWIKITFIGIAFAIFYLVSMDFLAKPWRDEIGTADTAINFVLYGKWQSDVWNYTYNPLHAFFLIGWLKIFGVSHWSVCSLNVIFALLSFLYIEKSLIKINVLKYKFTGISFCLLFWLGFMLSSIITKGRIDILAMLWAIILTNCLLKKNDDYIALTKIFIFSSLLMLTCIYVVPFIAIFLFLFFIINFKNYGRIHYLKIGISTAVGFILGFMLVCLFYMNLHSFYHFLETYLSFNGTLESKISIIQRIKNAYTADLVSVASCIFLWIFVIYKKIKNDSYILFLSIVTLIPFIMTLSGRYQPYYSWMMEITTLACFVYLMDRFATHKQRKIILTFVIFISMIRPVYWLLKRPEEYRKRADIECFLHKNDNILKNYSNVYIINEFSYYFFVDNGFHCYYNTYKIPDKIAMIDSICKEYLPNYKEYYPQPYLSKKGILFTCNDKELQRICKELDDNHYCYNILTKEGNYALTEYYNEK